MSTSPPTCGRPSPCRAAEHACWFHTRQPARRGAAPAIAVQLQGRAGGRLHLLMAIQPALPPEAVPGSSRWLAVGRELGQRAVLRQRNAPWPPPRDHFWKTNHFWTALTAMWHRRTAPPEALLGRGPSQQTLLQRQKPGAAAHGKVVQCVTRANWAREGLQLRPPTAPPCRRCRCGAQRGPEHHPRDAVRHTSRAITGCCTGTQALAT